MDTDFIPLHQMVSLAERSDFQELRTLTFVTTVLLSVVKLGMLGKRPVLGFSHNEHLANR